MIMIDDLPASVTGKIALPNEPVLLEENPDEIGALSDDWLGKPLKEARRILVEQFEFRYLTNLLRLNHGRVGLTAKKAGIEERTLFDKMKQYGMKKEDFR